MPELEQLHAGHAPAVLAFELANRAYFAASVSDRGDEFFDQFPDRHSALLAERPASAPSTYWSLMTARFWAGSTCTTLKTALPYSATGSRAVPSHGVATRSVRELCRIAAARHGLRTLRAATSHGNAASQKVLAKAGFVPVGPATPADLGGKSGAWYQRDLQP